MSILTVEDQFFASMTADATVASYLGSGSSARLYDSQLPMNAVFPCAVYERISTVPQYTHGAPDNSNVFRANLGNAGKTRFQVTVFGDPTAVRPANSARQIAQAIIDAIKNFNAWDGTTRGPNQVLNQRGGVQPNTQPPIPFQRFDVFIPYADNT